MSYSYHIEASEGMLRMLGEKFKPVDDARFLYCLQINKWTPEDVHTFNAKVMICFDYVYKEYGRMQELKKVYNLEYPTDHKKYFSLVVEVISKMRSTLSTYKSILDKFRPKRKGKKKKHRFNNNKKIDPTALHEGEYSKDAFAWEPYQNKAVEELYHNINNFFILAGKIYQEAITVIEEEKAIRQNPDLACPLYEKSFQRSVKDNKKIIEMMIAGNVNVDHDIVKAMEKAEDVRMLIASMFHELSFDEFNFFCACKAISDGRKAGLTDEETAIFGKDNSEKIFRIRILLDHIVELIEQNKDITGWKGMLNGEFVMHLLYWCGWDGSKNEDMLKYITKRCEGKIGVVKMGAVLVEKRKLAKIENDTIFEQQKSFNKQIEAFIDSIIAKSKGKVA